MNNTARTVRTIPPTMVQPIIGIAQINAKKRVAAYARVSTDNDEQVTSFEAQVDYYTRKIQENAGWSFIEVYMDEGISATNTKKRDGFNRMIADALNGKIDLILTKSVSRFARNTVDTLTTVRKLKEKGVEVYFEKENIYTMDSKGELLITIMSSLAQEESRSISENVTWGKRKQFADGKVSLPYKRFLGYEKGPDGLPCVIEEQAKIVRQIYRLFLEGKSYGKIASLLTDEGILSPGGKATWSASTVESILKNEKYCGSALLQKTVTVDFLTKKKKANEGEQPQYYVENSHEGIILKEEFDLVQQEIERRKESGRYSVAKSCFSGKIICGECGSLYGSKTWHSTDKYRKTVWRCNNKYGKGKVCTTPTLDEDTIKRAFVTAFNGIITDKEEILQNCKDAILLITDTTDLDLEESILSDKYEEYATLLRQRIAENAALVLDQEEYNRQYGRLMAQYEFCNAQLEETISMKAEKIKKRDKMNAFIQELSARECLIDEFDESAWYALVESVTMQADGHMVFRWKAGRVTEVSNGSDNGSE